MKREEDIIRRVKEAKENVAAADELIRDYMPFIKSETARITGGSTAEGSGDELSIALMGFHEAIEGYTPERGAFIKFASLVIKRRIIDYRRKEKRFSGNVSFSSTVSGQEEISIEDTVESEEKPYEQIHDRDAVRQEIEELSDQLGKYGITMTDVAKNCPRQERTLKSCGKALGFARENRHLIEALKKTGKLPIGAISEGTEVEKKTLERHRKYIVALFLIYSNGYDSIRAHLKQVFNKGKGGMEA